jgi:hypothetical protein
MRTHCPECYAPLSLETEHSKHCKAGELKRPNSGRFILIDREPVECPDLIYWAEWFESHQEDCRVAHTIVGGLWEVSTIFLGVDMSARAIFGQPGGGPGEIFETIVFRLAFKRRTGNQTGGRCGTWAEAVAQHLLMVQSFERARTG